MLDPIDLAKGDGVILDWRNRPKVTPPAAGWLYDADGVPLPRGVFLANTDTGEVEYYLTNDDTHAVLIQCGKPVALKGRYKAPLTFVPGVVGG